MRRMMVNTRRSSGEEEPLPNINPKYEREVKRITYATHFNIVLYALCYWIQIGVLPYLTKKLGVDAKMFGYLQSLFAFVQLCGGPIYGRFGDLFGTRNALILAFLASASSYGLLAVASSFSVLLLSRLPSVCMHSFHGSQMVITDTTTEKERSSAFGRLGISYGIGMVVGPLIGGFVTDHFDEQTAAGTAMLGSVISVIIVILFIPHNTKKKVDSQSGSVFDIKKYASIFQTNNFTYLFAVKIISGFPIGIFQSMFSIFAMEYFHLKAKENGMVLSYVGIMSMLVQGFGISFLSKRYSEATLIKFSVVSITFGYFLLIFVKDIIIFCIVMLPLICGGAVLSVIITSVITKTVSSKDTGAALGLSFTTHSLIRTVSPSIGGILYASFGFPIFGIGGFIVNGALAAYLFLHGRENL